MGRCVTCGHDVSGCEIESGKHADEAAMTHQTMEELGAKIDETLELIKKARVCGYGCAAARCAMVGFS